MNFSSLGLTEPLQRAVRTQGYETPTPIQLQCIPAVLEGRDVMAAAQTGTGKTAGFSLPILQLLSENPSEGRRHIRALILTPTRELAAQVQENIRDYGQYLPLRSAVIFGGVNAKPQIAQLRQGVDILVATPGRLLDLRQQGALSLNKVEILVLDEADRMLDMGFIHDIRKVFALLPQQRQTLLFSATFSQEIRQLIKDVLHDPVKIEVAPHKPAAETVNQQVYRVDKQNKPALLKHLIEEGAWEQVLVFTRTKHGANRLAQRLDRSGIHAAAIHGNKSQGSRTRTLAGFKEGSIRVLVATDIAARGLDIDQLPHVVNFELPNVAEDYVHRIGRTGRAGASGEAVSLVSAEEEKLLVAIEKVLKRPLPAQEIPGFEPDPDAVTAVPESQPQNRSGRGRSNGNRSYGRNRSRR